MMGGVKMILSVAQGTTTAQSFSCRSGKAFFLVCIPLLIENPSPFVWNSSDFLDDPCRQR